MIKTLLSCCLCLVLLNSCSDGGGEASEIKSLVSRWTKVDPNAIGGPYEMRKIREIQKIDVGEIKESRWVKMGCAGCLETAVTLACIDVEGNSQNIVYQLRKEEGKWSITEWELMGKEKGAFNPNIDEQVIEARREFK